MENTRLLNQIKKEFEMKKTLIATALACAASTAFALDVGVTGSYDHVSPNYFAGGYGLVVGHRFANTNYGVTAAFDRYPDIKYNKYTLMAGRDVATLGTAVLTIKSGVSYLDTRYNDGYAFVAGVGSTIGLTDKISLTTDFRHQWGQDSVKKLNGNIVTFGLMYSF